jgi:hypothetical protein
MSLPKSDYWIIILRCKRLRSDITIELQQITWNMDYRMYALCKFWKLNTRCWRPTLRTLRTLPMSVSKGDDVENIPMFFLKKNSSVTLRYYIWHYIYALKQTIQVTSLTNHHQMTNITYHRLSSHVPRITEVHKRNLMLLVDKMT